MGRYRLIISVARKFIQCANTTFASTEEWTTAENKCFLLRLFSFFWLYSGRQLGGLESLGQMFANMWCRNTASISYLHQSPTSVSWIALSWEEYRNAVLQWGYSLSRWGIKFSYLPVVYDILFFYRVMLNVNDEQIYLGCSYSFDKGKRKQQLICLPLFDVSFFLKSLGL